MSMATFAKELSNKAKTGETPESPEIRERHAAQKESDNMNKIEYLADFHLGQRIIGKNEICCDCNAKNPTWALISHGVLVCIACAGVHRSLGTSISKVRSINGDKWTNEMVRQMYHIENHQASNEQFNKIWEYFVDSKNTGYYKPIENSKRELRDKYIIAKYDKKLFHKNNNNKNNNANENNNDEYKGSLIVYDKNISIENNKNKEENMSNDFSKSKTQCGMLQTNGTLELYFMSASELPVADIGIMGVGNKSDPYVYCYQNDPITLSKRQYIHLKKKHKRKKDKKKHKNKKKMEKQKKKEKDINTKDKKEREKKEEEKIDSNSEHDSSHSSGSNGDSSSNGDNSSSSESENDESDKNGNKLKNKNDKDDIKKEETKKSMSMSECNCDSEEFRIAPDDKEKIKYATHAIDNTLNPIWMTDEQKESMNNKKNNNGKNKVNKNINNKMKHVKPITLSVIETLPIEIELWDYDALTSDDLMGYTQLDIVKECFPFDKEHKITKTIKIAKEFENQKKYIKKGKKASVTFYAKYNKLF